MNIEKDLSIDKLNLDVEVQKHSSLLYQYSEELNEHKKELADLELQLEIMTATVAGKIRKGEHPEAKDQKITEGFVKEILAKEPELVALQREIIEQKSLVQKLSSVVEAFNHRKYMLIKLIDLYLANYFADVKPSKKADAVAEEQIRSILN